MHLEAPFDKFRKFFQHNAIVISIGQETVVTFRVKYMISVRNNIWSPHRWVEYQPLTTSLYSFDILFLCGFGRDALDERTHTNTQSTHKYMHTKCIKRYAIQRGDALSHIPSTAIHPFVHIGMLMLLLLVAVICSNSTGTQNIQHKKERMRANENSGEKKTQQHQECVVYLLTRMHAPCIWYVGMSFGVCMRGGHVESGITEFLSSSNRDNWDHLKTNTHTQTRPQTCVRTHKRKKKREKNILIVFRVFFRHGRHLCG